MRRVAKIALALVAALAVAGAGAWWLWVERESGVTPSAAAQSAPAKATPVEASEVEVGTVTEEVRVAGTLRSNESVGISPEIDGLISAIHFEEGDPVEQGALLFELDDSIYQAQVAEAKARLTLAEQNYDRAIELLQKKVGTKRTRDEARAELETAKAVLGLAQARLAKTDIHAPFAGLLGLRTVSVGEYVEAGQRLVNLENMRPIKVDFRIAERYLPQLREGQQVEVRVESLPAERFTGKVTAIDPEVDPQSRSVSVRAEVPNEERRLRPGQFARVALVVAKRENAVLVPEQALVPQGGESYVFKVEDGKAKLTKVEVGRRREGQAEIVDGLGPGDVVVTGGQQKIRDGAAVEPVAAGEVS